MGLTTKNLDRKNYTTEERRNFIANLREYHQPYFERIDEPKAYYIAKILYGYPPDRALFYPSEISDPNKPLYVEWVSKDYEPEDNRRLYKYIYNPEYASEYRSSERGGYQMYEIPKDHFELVKPGPGEDPLNKPEQIVMEFDLNLDTAADDCPFDQVTLRDIAALLLRKPVSRKEWLNKIIIGK